MPEFRRPPEWDQQADRHTHLTDPVLTVRQLSRLDFARRAPTRIDSALVFVNGRGAYATYLPPRRPGRSEIAAARYTAVYEVDIGLHHVSLEFSLPSDDDAFEFDAEADLTWQVDSPEDFVRSGERDVPALLARRIRQRMRTVTRRHPVEASPAAEQAVHAALHADDALGAASIGLRVTCDVRLRLDDSAIAHHQQLRALRYADEQLTPAHQLRLREDRLNTERALEQGRQQHELVMQQQDLGHEHALLQGKQQIELQEIERQKIDFYQYHLQQGGVATWAFHLAKHPEDSRLVMEHLRQDQLILIKSQLEVATEIIRGDAAEEYELEEPKRLALQAINHILTQQLPGATEGPAPLPQMFGEPGAAPGASADAPADAATSAIAGDAGPPGPHETAEERPARDGANVAASEPGSPGQTHPRTHSQTPPPRP